MTCYTLSERVEAIIAAHALGETNFDAEEATREPAELMRAMVDAVGALRELADGHEHSVFSCPRAMAALDQLNKLAPGDELLVLMKGQAK